MFGAVITSGSSALWGLATSEITSVGCARAFTFSSARWTSLTGFLEEIALLATWSEGSENAWGGSCIPDMLPSILCSGYMLTIMPPSSTFLYIDWLPSTLTFSVFPSLTLIMLVVVEASSDCGPPSITLGRTSFSSRIAVVTES
uniref:Uncharacterized protein n=1 Tax=Ixodes ricinus TaxID=34613 RepID=A0A6B0UU60_IXORI